MKVTGEKGNHIHVSSPFSYCLVCMMCKLSTRDAEDIIPVDWS